MSLIFTVLATSTTPASITVPITAVGFHTLEVIPPTGHTWTEYDQDGGTATISRPLDHREIIHRPYPFVPGTTILKVQMDSGSGTFTCVLK